MQSLSSYPVEYVDSGTFRISRRAEKKLAACLGSCVGVTLCDDAAGVGGLIHILLPEPPGTADPERRGCYATTGLPDFIEALCAAGADPAGLRATVAGGALVGPLSDQDFRLDIGGRSTERVIAILRRADIPVERSETGGFLGCRLDLDLHCFDTTIEPITLPPTGKAAAPAAASAAEMIAAVKPIPQVALKLIRMMNDKDYDIGRIAQVVYEDQVICARVISLCNAAVFGLSAPVDSIQRALIMLGEKQLLQIALLASVQPYFSVESMGYSLCKGGLFHHGIRAAISAATIAATLGGIEPDAAYTAGLLHDIGKAALDQYVARAHPLLYRGMREEKRALVIVERELLGTDHAEVGRRLAQLWSLPEALAVAIACHHAPRTAGQHRELAGLVCLVDGILSFFQAGEDLECFENASLDEGLQVLGLCPADLPKLVDTIPNDVFRRAMLF